MERISTTAYEDISRQMESVCNWLSEMNVDWKGTRIAEYRRYFTEFPNVQRSALNGSFTPTNDQYVKHFEMALEASELVRIFSAFNHRTDDDLRRRLLRLREGTPRLTDETNNNRQARDFAFELSVAAGFAGATRPIDLSGAADVRIPLDGCVVIVECKRPISLRGLDERVKDGLDQIAVRADAERRLGKKHRAFLALNVSTIANPEFQALHVRTSREIGDRLSNFVRSWIGTHEHSLRRAVNFKRANLMAVLLVFDAPAYVDEESREYVTHQVNIYQTRKFAQIDRQILAELALPTPQSFPASPQTLHRPLAPA